MLLQENDVQSSVEIDMCKLYGVLDWLVILFA